MWSQSGILESIKLAAWKWISWLPLTSKIALHNSMALDHARKNLLLRWRIKSSKIFLITSTTQTAFVTRSMQTTTSSLRTTGLKIHQFIAWPIALRVPHVSLAGHELHFDHTNWLGPRETTYENSSGSSTLLTYVEQYSNFNIDDDIDGGFTKLRETMTLALNYRAKPYQDEAGEISWYYGRP